MSVGGRVMNRAKWNRRSTEFLAGIACEDTDQNEHEAGRGQKDTNPSSGTTKH